LYFFFFLNLININQRICLNRGEENCKDLDIYDIVFGSEILYYSKSHEALLETLMHICDENTLCVFIYKTRNLGEEHFFELAKQKGFTIEFVIIILIYYYIYKKYIFFFFTHNKYIY